MVAFDEGVEDLCSVGGFVLRVNSGRCFFIDYL